MPSAVSAISREASLRTTILLAYFSQNKNDMNGSIPSPWTSSSETSVALSAFATDNIQDQNSNYSLGLPQAHSTLDGETCTPHMHSPQGATTNATGVSPNAYDEEEYEDLCANYLNMLSQDERDVANGHAPLDALVNQAHSDASGELTAFAGARSALEWSPPPLEGDLDSSPSDSPVDEMLVTPALDFEDDSHFVLSANSAVESSSVPFEDVERMSGLEHLKDVAVSLSPVFDDLIAMPSPTSPTLYDKSPLAQSPRIVPSQGPNSTWANANGTRPGITPDALTAIDAPIKVRKYSGPSCTAKKEVPKFFQKRKRASAAATKNPKEAEEGRDSKRCKKDVAAEVTLEPTDAEFIELKRRQNTEAARRSRRRKLEYQQNLEARIESLEQECNHWKTRTSILEVVLRCNGVKLPDCLPN